jgi:hypothetical protein
MAQGLGVKVMSGKFDDSNRVAHRARGRKYNILWGGHAG